MKGKPALLTSRTGKLQEARLEADRYIEMYLKGHSTLREFVGDLEKAGKDYPSVPQRKSVFVQV
jgi:hypothetical protein